jgi:hypothetical protein
VIDIVGVGDTGVVDPEDREPAHRPRAPLGQHGVDAKHGQDEIRREIDEAARVDGATRVGVLTRMVIPIIAPSLAAVAVIAFFHGWNEYIFALTFTTQDSLHTASVGLAGFIGELTTPEIGRVLNRDHATVIYGCRRIAGLLEDRNTGMQDNIRDITANINSCL